MRRIKTRVLAALACTLLMAGCADEGTGTQSDMSGDISVAEMDNSSAEFGQTLTTPSGIQITAYAPKTVEVGDITIGDAYDLSSGTLISIALKIKNDTDQSLNAINFQNLVKSGGETPKEIVLPTLGLPPVTGVVEPGGTLNYSVGYLVKDAGDLELTWSDPNYDEEEVTFFTKP